METPDLSRFAVVLERLGERGIPLVDVRRSPLRRGGAL